MKTMPFYEQLAPFKGKKVKKIINNKKEVTIAFNDRFGSTLYFTPKGKYKYVGTTTKYKT